MIQVSTHRPSECQQVMFKLTHYTIFIGASLACLFGATGSRSVVIRVSNQPTADTSVELLGNPAAKRYRGDRAYARNAWDLQAYEGHLYVASGNSNNDGPAPNAGPVDIWSYDPQSGQFASEQVIDEEQIALFRTTPTELLI